MAALRRIPRAAEPGGLQPRGSQRSQTPTRQKRASLRASRGAAEFQGGSHAASVAAGGGPRAGQRRREGGAVRLVSLAGGAAGLGRRIGTRAPAALLILALRPRLPAQRPCARASPGSAFRPCRRAPDFRRAPGFRRTAEAAAAARGRRRPAPAAFPGAALWPGAAEASAMFSFNMFDHPIPRVFQSRFSTQYRCFSVSMLAGPNDRSDVERGGKSTCRSPVTRSPSRPACRAAVLSSPRLRVNRIWSQSRCLSPGDGREAG